MQNIVRALLFGIALATQGCRDAPKYDGAVDLTGEWAVEWEDKSNDYKETIYVWFEQHDAAITGNALDPNLIPATVKAENQKGKITFLLSPDYGIGFHAPTPPTSTFKGVVTGPDTMEGRYRIPGVSGPWKAQRTERGAKRSVAVTADTVVDVLLTSHEYDRMLHPLAVLDPKDSVYEPLTSYESKNKEALREGDQYRLKKKIGELAGWLYYYRQLGDHIRISPDSKEVSEHKQIQDKILKALNLSGYPWQAVPP